MSAEQSIDRDAVARLIKAHATGAIPGYGAVSMMLKQELWQLEVIWHRFLDSRAELQRVDHDKVEKDQYRRVAIATRIDLKSIFLFGDILLNTCVLATELVGGKAGGVDYWSYSTFRQSIRGREYDDLPGKIARRAGDLLDTIDASLGFYRDKFIVHPQHAYSQMEYRSLYSPEYQLRHWHYKPDLGALAEIERELGLAVDINPEESMGYLERIRADEHRVDAIVRHLSSVDDEATRKSAARVIRSVGMLSPDPYETMHDLLKAVEAFLIELHDEAVSHDGAPTSRLVMKDGVLVTEPFKSSTKSESDTNAHNAADGIANFAESDPALPRGEKAGGDRTA